MRSLTVISVLLCLALVQSNQPQTKERNEWEEEDGGDKLTPPVPSKCNLDRINELYREILACQSFRQPPRPSLGFDSLGRRGLSQSDLEGMEDVLKAIASSGGGGGVLVSRPIPADVKPITVDGVDYRTKFFVAEERPRGPHPHHHHRGFPGRFPPPGYPTFGFRFRPPPGYGHPGYGRKPEQTPEMDDANGKPNPGEKPDDIPREPNTPDGFPFVITGGKDGEQGKIDPNSRVPSFFDGLPGRQPFNPFGSGSGFGFSPNFPPATAGGDEMSPGLPADFDLTSVYNSLGDLFNNVPSRRRPPLVHPEEDDAPAPDSESPPVPRVGGIDPDSPDTTTTGGDDSTEATTIETDMTTEIPITTTAMP